MIRNILKIIVIFIFGMAGGIFADQIFWPYFVERPLFYQYQLEQQPIYVTERNEVVIQENTALQDSVEKVEKAVVGVRAKTRAGKILEGSGLIVTSDGLMVTLANLVPAGSDFAFFINGQALSYQILRRNLESNLALVKLEGANFNTLGFADFSRIKVGQRVFLVGAILEAETSRKMANEGIIKSFGEDFIQTNIFEESNISGSPLFDIEGRFLGINIIDSTGKVVAIPVPKIRTFLGL